MVEALLYKAGAVSNFALFEKFLKENKIKVRFDEPLYKYTTFSIGGPAKYFILVENPEQLIQVIDACNNCQIDYYILGGGSNLLISDKGVYAAVIHLSNFSQVYFDGNLVIVGANYSLPRLVKQCVQRGLGGLEPLAGIPGTVGGAVVMNAGGNYGTIGDVVSFVYVIDNTEIIQMERHDIEFSYRDSNLKDKMVISAGFRLNPCDKEILEINYQNIIREKRKSQPLDKSSAGCVFKNPPDNSAGRMIDRCGLKGYRIGDAVVSEKHANFIVNEGRASSNDVLRLIDVIREKVFKFFKTFLELEIRVW
jgi:UDP-N-acetylmuramate dehydrogenase